MDHAARIVTDITGCTSEQGQAVIAALVECGWSRPEAQSRESEPSAVTSMSLDALPAGTEPTAHTDGACSGNPGPGGWSVVFSVEGAIVGEFSGRDADTTNNRMELTAALEAIKRAPIAAVLEIVTDSQLVVGWLSKGWKRNNPGVATLCQEIDEARAARTARCDLQARPRAQRRPAERTGGRPGNRGDQAGVATSDDRLPDAVIAD